MDNLARMPPKPPPQAILDVRPSEAYEQLHRLGSVNIPLEELTRRIHELPPKHTALTIFDTQASRARRACSQLRARGRSTAEVAHGEPWLHAGPTAKGPCRDWLWRPHDLLVRAVEQAGRIWPSLEGRRALDLACGAGREAVFLAMSGFEVEAWDILPDALSLCRNLAARHGVRVQTRRRDLEVDTTLEAARYDLICCFNFLHRPLMPSIAGAVRSGGLVVCETFVQPQRELFGKPRRDSHLLRRGELPTWFSGWRVLASREGLAAPRRCVASLIAVKPTCIETDSRHRS